MGNIIPPLSSKFDSESSLQLALDKVDTNTTAFSNALDQAKTQLKPGRNLNRFKFQEDVGEVVGYGFQRPEGTKNHVASGQKLTGKPVKIDGLTKVEARYQRNPATDKFEINTLFPVP